MTSMLWATKAASYLRISVPYRGFATGAFFICIIYASSVLFSMVVLLLLLLLLKAW